MTVHLTAFAGHDIIAEGDPPTVEAVARARQTEDPEAQILIFDQRTGGVVDPAPPFALPAPSSRGRPKLGVTSREVTLLPRHWAWLSTQRGGASAALRRLVEAASREPQDEGRVAKEAAYRFMTALAGNFPGYEAALRALFQGDEAEFLRHIASWPGDVARFAHGLAFGAGGGPEKPPMAKACGDDHDDGA